MRIGEFARKAGMEAQTIRLYERRRILPAPRRTASGYRIYETADLENLRLVQRCQELGFTLREIRELLGLHRAVAALTTERPQEMRRIAELARQRLEQLDGKLRALRQMKGQLVDMLDRFHAAGCPGRPRRRPATKPA